MPDLRDVAREALQHYDLTPRRITWAADSFNTIYRVTADSGSYALRIGSPLQIYAEGTLRAEAAWLDRLRDHGLTVPAVHRTADGEVGAKVGGRVCALFDWVAGRSMRTRLSAPAAAELGRLAARLHENSAGWEPAEPPDVHLADRVLYWRLPDLLTSPQMPCRDVFAEALDRAQEAVEELWRTPPHRPHLLHGDLIPANAVMTGQGTVVPIDFQDMVVGLEVQDVAITIADLRRVPAGTRLVDAFRTGYAEVRPWPEVSPAVLESLMAGRLLHQMNLTLNIHGAEGLTDYLADRAERLRRWLRSRPEE